MKFKKVLSDKRIPIPTPNDCIDENGKAIFGTFKTEFPNMNFLDIHKQSILPDFTNKLRYTSWEALEMNFDDILFLTAVCNMGTFGTSLTIIYDKKEKKCHACQAFMLPSQAIISKNLLDGAITESKSFLNKVKFVNDFGNGKAFVSGRTLKPGCIFKYDVKLTRVSQPSIVMIPFGKNKPLYSQKDLFKVDGYVKFNGKKYKAKKYTTAIIDDHRGYYPYKSHYDWVTTMGTNTVNGKKQFFGFNLTRNQSINQDDYNENLIWFEGASSRLTPVKFVHEEENLWHIIDEHGMVDVYFEIGDRHHMKLNLGFIYEDYHITFGEIRGFVMDEDGNKYILDGMCGIGEDKTLRI
ncbi:MAG: DUF2804 family protein [Ruminococcaceae bacterium]|nr:DUF2804 family protein [Oscillospiraceae bacterium]